MNFIFAEICNFTQSNRFTSTNLFVCLLRKGSDIVSVKLKEIIKLSISSSSSKTECNKPVNYSGVSHCTNNHLFFSSIVCFRGFQTSWNYEKLMTDFSKLYRIFRSGELGQSTTSSFTLRCLGVAFKTKNSELQASIVAVTMTMPI